MEVDIFIPCFIDQIYPDTGFNMVKVLKKAGVKVNYNTNQTCCGQFAFNGGFWDEAKKLGEKFIKDFSNNRPIVGPSASCIGYVKNSFDELFYNSAYHNEYKQLQRNIYEITDFLVNVIRVTDFGSVFEHKVTYHDSCAALREYKLNNEPRTLLKKVKGLELIEMKDTDVCCGFGGTFSVKFEPISVAMAEQKVHNALDTGADYIVSTDSSCLMHQYGYIKKHKLPLKVAHVVDVLASGI
jgi:L-lactate dehydrogenase complex protein LldE